MSTPIKIVVTAETAQAAADLRAFVERSGAGLRQLAGGGDVADKSLRTMRESALGLREGFHTLEMGVYLLGGQRFPELAEAVMGVRSGMMLLRTASMLTGASMLALAPYAAVVAAAVGAGILVWKEWNSAEDEAIDKAKKLSEAWKELPGLIQKVNDAQKAGLLSPAAANNLTAIATGHKKLYRDSLGNITESPTEVVQRTVGAGGHMTAGGAFVATEGGLRDVTIATTPLTAAEQEKHAQELIGLADEQIAAKKQYSELAAKAAQEELDGIAKTRAANHEKYQKLRDDLQAAYNVMTAKFGGVNLPENSAAHQNNLAALNLAEAKANVEAETKIKEEAAKKQEAIAKENAATLKRLGEERKVQLHEIATAEDEVRKIAQLKQEAERSDLEAQIRGVESNPYLTGNQKAGQSLPLMRQLYAKNAGSIASDQSEAASTQDQAARYELENKIARLKQQQFDLQNRINQAEGHGTFFQSFQHGAIQMATEFQNLAATLGSGAFAQIRQGINGIGSAVASIVTGAKTAGQAFAELGMQMLSSFISMIVEAILWATVAIPILTALGVLSGGATASAGAAITTAAVSSTISSVGSMAMRDSGGPGDAGTPYLIGAGAQPEIFVPHSAGRFFPAGQYASMNPSSGGGVASSGKVGVTIIQVDDTKKAMLEAMKSPAGEQIHIAHTMRNKGKMGFNT
jgi:hypothetical protein